MTQNFISCRLAKHFESPEKFVPERWLKSGDRASKVQTNPYLVLPFGHGMRSCIARRFAEQNMLVLMLRVMRTHEDRTQKFLNVFFLSITDYTKIRNWLGWSRLFGCENNNDDQ